MAELQRDLLIADSQLSDLVVGRVVDALLLQRVAHVSDGDALHLVERLQLLARLEIEEEQFLCLAVDYDDLFLGLRHGDVADVVVTVQVHPLGLLLEHVHFTHVDVF